MTGTQIEEIRAREILSRVSIPTFEAEVILRGGARAAASTPRGSSEGAHEPHFLLDRDPRRYHGRGMQKAVDLVEGEIAEAIRGTDALDQVAIDETLTALDGTDDLSRLGVNSVLAVSLACARAASEAIGTPLYTYLLRFFDIEVVTSLPKPLVVVIEGGAHADNSTDFQEYMLMGLSEDTSDAIRHCAETYQELRSVLHERGYEVNVGYEGAYALTNAQSNSEPFDYIEEAVQRCGLTLGEDIALAMDCAASEIQRGGEYVLAREGRSLSAEEQIALYEAYAEAHPSLRLVEDGLGEDDWENWPVLRQRLGGHLLIVGDDLTVTNAGRVERAVRDGAINALLVKPNQAGTLTEAVRAIKSARAGRCEIIVSHRGGGETNDTFIVDLGIASGAALIKCGIARGERVAKYNYLMQVASAVDLPLTAAR